MNRKDIAERIVKIHISQIPMESGWRDQNDFRVEQFAYSLADWILFNFNYRQGDTPNRPPERLQNEATNQ